MAQNYEKTFSDHFRKVTEYMVDSFYIDNLKYLSADIKKLKYQGEIFFS